MWLLLRRGHAPLREWPAPQPGAVSQVVFAAPRIKCGIGNVTSGRGSTLQSGARAGDTGPGPGPCRSAPALAAASAAAPPGPAAAASSAAADVALALAAATLGGSAPQLTAVAQPSLQPPLQPFPRTSLPPAESRLLLEARGKTCGSQHWPDGSRVSRFYLAAPGTLSEQEAADVIGAPQGCALKRVDLKCGATVWSCGAAQLIVVEAAAPSAGKRRAGTEAAAAAAAAAGRAGGASGCDAPPEAAPSSCLERRGQQWGLAVAANCVYRFMEAVVLANFDALEALLPRLPQLEGGGGVNWDRVHGGVENLSPLHLAVQCHRTWPPRADILAGSVKDSYTVPHMPVAVRRRLVHWLLDKSTPPPPVLPRPQRPDASPRGRRSGMRPQGDGGGSSGGSRRGAGGERAGAAAQSHRAGPKSVLAMARNTRRSVPLLTLMRWADCDGQDWRPLVAELCAHMSFDDYCNADSNKGWYPHHMASSRGSRPWRPAADAPAAAAAGGSPDRPAGGGAAPTGLHFAGPPLPGSRGCLQELLRQLLRMAEEKLAAGGSGGSHSTGSQPKRQRRSSAGGRARAFAEHLAGADGSSAAPLAPHGQEPVRMPERDHQAQPAAQPGATQPPPPQQQQQQRQQVDQASALVSHLLFHLPSSNYDGRLLAELAAAMGMRVEAAEETAPSGVFSMRQLSEDLLAAQQEMAAAAAAAAAAACEIAAVAAAEAAAASQRAGGATEAACGAAAAGRGRASGRNGRGGVRVAGLGAGRRRREGAGRRPARQDDSWGKVTPESDGLSLDSD